MELRDQIEYAINDIPLATIQTACHVALFNVVELQQHSPLFNNTSVTSYVLRMIISVTSLFKYMKNDEHVAMLFQCLLDHIHKESAQ